MLTLIPISYLIQSKVGGFDEIVKFTHSYRNGHYHGNFWYTFLAVKVCPLLVFYLLSRTLVPLSYLIFPIITILIAISVLGLRTFTFPVILGLIIRFGTKAGKIAFTGFIVAICLGLIKSIVNDNVSLESVFYNFVGVLNRHDLQSILPDDMFYNGEFNFLSENAWFNRGVENITFKEAYYSSNQAFQKNIGSAGDYNSSAMPLYVILNVFIGPFAFVPVSVFIFLIYSLYGRLDMKSGDLSGLFWHYIVCIIINMLVEDYALIFVLMDLPIVIVSSYLVLLIIKKKSGSSLLPLGRGA